MYGHNLKDYELCSLDSQLQARKTVFSYIFLVNPYMYGIVIVTASTFPCTDLPTGKTVRVTLFSGKTGLGYTPTPTRENVSNMNDLSILPILLFSNINNFWFLRFLEL